MKGRAIEKRLRLAPESETTCQLVLVVYNKDNSSSKWKLAYKDSYGGASNNMVMAHEGQYFSHVGEIRVVIY